MTLVLLGLAVALLAALLYVLTNIEDVVRHAAARPVREPLPAAVTVAEAPQVPVSSASVWSAPSVVEGGPQLTVHLLDADELVCQHTLTVSPSGRRQTMVYGGQVYAAARVTDTGAWLYRHDPRARP